MASNNKNAADARAAAKAKAQQQVKAKERRTTVIIIAVAAAVIVAFGGIVFFIVNSSKVPALSEAHGPAVADETGGIPVGTDGTVGTEQPADAARLDLYVDFMCPVCNQFEQINSADIDTMREDGTIALFYHPVSILDPYSAGTNYSTRAANAAAVVADQDPEHFLDFVAVLYANQPEENSAGLDDDTLAALAEGVGVPADVASQFSKGEFSKWVTAATDQASIDGLTGTPTVMVNREILDQKQVPYFQSGVLKTYIESLDGN